MARLLKGVYFKAFSHSKFCSYSTKTNPYQDVLKTLRLREQELKIRDQISLKNNEGLKVSNDEHLSRQCMSQNERALNAYNEDLHLNNDIDDVKHSERTIKRASERHCDNILPKEKAFSLKNSDILKENFNFVEKVLEDGSEDLFPKKEEILISNAEHSFKKFISNEIKNTGAMRLQENVETFKHSEVKTTNKSVCDNETSKPKRKRTKSKTKSTSLSEKEEIRTSSVEHMSNNLIPLNETKKLHELAGNLSLNEGKKTGNHSKSSERTSDKLSDKKSQKSEKKPKKSQAKSKIQLSKDTCDNETTKQKRKRSKKSEAKSTSLSEKEEIRTPNAEHISNNLITVEETKKLHEITSNLSLNEDSETKKHSNSFEGRTSDKSIDKKSQKKSKSSQSKPKIQLSMDREDLKKRAKLYSAVKNLKSVIETYINADKVDVAQRYFDYLRISKTRKEFVNVEIYNVVISGWAQLGRLDKVKHLFLLMPKDKIVPNLMSYAGYLEAISRSKYVDVSEIPNIVNEMKAKGYSAKELLQKCVFVGDQMQKILEVLGFVERDLKLPLYVPEPYSCKLIEQLNDKSYEKKESHFNYCFQNEDILKISNTQMEMETGKNNCSSVKIKSVVVPEITEKVKNAREYIKVCEAQWRQVLTRKINEIKSPKQAKQGKLILSGRESIYPFLLLIDTEILVNVLLQETRMLAETAEFYSPNVKILYKDVGMQVMRAYFQSLNKKRGVTDKVDFMYQKYLSYLLNPDLCSKYSSREYWEFLKSKYPEGPTIDVPNSYWPYSLVVFVGSVLYDILIKTICFHQHRVLKKSDHKYITPSFHIVYENQGVKLSRQIRTNDVFAKLYRDAKLEHLNFHVSLVPMLAPPRPWVKYDSGGLLVTEIPFIRFPEQAQSQRSCYLKLVPHQLNACFDALNNLSLCPWIINKSLLDIVIKIFQDGGSEALDIPLNPENLIDPRSISASGKTEAIDFKTEMEYEKKKSEMTSLWFDCLYKLSIANHFRDEVFWFPHNLDFRGRVYPTPPHFNHLGSDLSRSILLFAAGKPLGKNGLDWLKIHLINLTGFKKRASHAVRLEYANEILPEILDSADNPFGGNKWWMKSDKPLQTLACCKEVASAVRHPDPEEYISHFPIHQDGSCNGLQHYAALGRDELGAIQVNLQPSDSPQDVYSGVAALVEKERARDEEEGVEIARALEGYIQRKVVKQTVMTFVYGVTSYGARLQVLKQLKDLPDFPEKYHHAAATYLMKKIFFSIREMFTATKKIQDWFTLCAEEITRVTGEPVEWITPLDLPVIQPYYKETIVRSAKFCPSKGDNNAHYVSHYEPYQSPNVRKQKNAFAPNFIHSLDSTHMMLTSLFCHRRNITFVSVHDCFWTHAVTVKEMNKICREQFVALHSQPNLENLSKFFMKRYPYSSEKISCLTKKQIRDYLKMQKALTAVPEISTFDINKVGNSEYFFN